MIIVLLSVFNRLSFIQDVPVVLEEHMHGFDDVLAHRDV